MKRQIVKGSTSQIITVFIQDFSSAIGAGLGSLDQNSGIVGGYVRTGEVGLALAVDENVTTEGTYEAPTTAGQVRIGTPANMRTGTYELHFHNNLFAAASESVFIILGGATDMAELVIEIELTTALVVPDAAGTAVTLADGAHGGSSTVLTLSQLVISGSHASGTVNIDNSGGAALNIDSSVTDAVVVGAGGGGDGFVVRGHGAGAGCYIVGGGSGQGLLIAKGLFIDTVEVAGTTILTGAVTMSAGLTAAITGTVSGNSTHDAAAVKTAIEENDSKIDHLWETTEDNAGTRRFTATSLSTPITELAAVPAANASIVDKLNWLFMLAKNEQNRVTNAATVLNDAGDAVIGTAVLGYDGTTFTREKWG